MTGTHTLAREARTAATIKIRGLIVVVWEIEGGLTCACYLEDSVAADEPLAMFSAFEEPTDVEEAERRINEACLVDEQPIAPPERVFRVVPSEEPCDGGEG